VLLPETPTNCPRIQMAFLTFRAEAGAGGEAGHIDDLYGELLARVPVDAAPHHAEGTPATQTCRVSHGHTQKHTKPPIQTAFALTRNACTQTHTPAKCNGLTRRRF